MRADKQTTQQKKTRERRNSPKITIPKPPMQDAFTQLCRKELAAECIKEHQFYKGRRWRFDYALPASKIALEVEGGVWTMGRHTRPKGFLNDIEKYNTATLLGWRVFRCTPEELYTTKTLLLLKSAINAVFAPEISTK